MVIQLQKKGTFSDSFSSNLPTVGIFDSGIGGLSIYDKIRKFFPNFHYIYVFDNIAFPYGEKNEEFIIKRVVKILTALQKRYILSLIVVACNTASTISLPILRKKFRFPIIGVVPAIKPATRLTVNRIIGLLATHATSQHPYTHNLIDKFANKCQVKILSSIELVKIAEAKLHGEIIPIELLHQILFPWTKMLEPPDTIVLGCTHFSFLQEELLNILPKGTNLVVSDMAIAHRVLQLFNKHTTFVAKSMKKNTAYCMKLTSKTHQLFPVLQHYGFETLEKLIL